MEIKYIMVLFTIGLLFLAGCTEENNNAPVTNNTNTDDVIHDDSNNDNTNDDNIQNDDTTNDIIDDSTNDDSTECIIECPEGYAINNDECECELIEDCITECGEGELQNNYPDCSCYTPVDTSNPNERNSECKHHDTRKYDLKENDEWDTEYEDCGDNEAGRLFVSWTNEWTQQECTETDTEIYEGKGITVKYSWANLPDNLVNNWDNLNGIKNYFVGTECELDECESGAYDRADISITEVLGYDAYYIVNQDGTESEYIVLAHACQNAQCHDYGTTFIKLSFSDVDDDEQAIVGWVLDNLFIE